MKIGSVDTEERIVLVAEIGNNHEGSFHLAQELIGQASEAGADAVKLQTLIPEYFVSHRDRERLDTMRRFALSLADTEKLITDASGRGIYVFSTPLDLVSLASLVPLVDTIKVASGDITFTPLIEAVASSGLDTIISTGASTLVEVGIAVGVLESIWAQDEVAPSLGILHCVSNYPALPSSVNLRAIATLAATFPRATIGYSDHTIGVEAAVLAAAAGARIIEKHFTLDKEFSDFRDHSLSADAQDLRHLRDCLDRVELLLGKEGKSPNESEISLIPTIRRSLAVTKDLPVGSTLGRTDLQCLRPEGGLPPSALSATIGRRLVVEKRAGEPLFESDLV